MLEQLNNRSSFGAVLLGIAAFSVSASSGNSQQAPPAPAPTQAASLEPSAAKIAPAAKDSTAAKTAAESEAERAKLRLREGTRLRDVTGRFRQNGDTLTFIDEQKREIGGLPNLNLERIIRMLKTVEEPESITWSVSGTITEFSGRNYLLINRAVYKAATPPPSPEALAK
jgi:hypothetical protein